MPKRGASLPPKKIQRGERMAVLSATNLLLKMHLNVSGVRATDMQNVQS